ncbi:hypothetical protein JYU34_006390 [Plutella xylostella]|uniref:Uncharacterized protein n=1 Tax=Plutella xylostella TaxID=51655 RepID=A0ABQ7QRV2_PLUXY|nr:hypothetical protein JYU34_006390 [Plutella xylostella]
MIKPMKSFFSKTSMTAEGCQLRLKILTLVVNTADLINERTSPALSVTHAIMAPSAIITTYIFIGTFVICGARYQHPTIILQVYAFICCAILHSSLSITVFQNLKDSDVNSVAHTVAHILNGMLPIFISVLLIAEVIMIFFDYQDPTNHENEQASSMSLASL